MAHIEPTHEQLLSVFQARRKAHWPEALADALADPIYGRIVRLHAKHLAAGRDDFAAARVHHRPEVIAPEPPHPAEAQSPRTPRAKRKATTKRAAAPHARTMPNGLDLKRAAAGDGDD